jgi:oligopeptide/dipeptide ABC transporter ATP-binding protein
MNAKDGKSLLRIKALATYFYTKRGVVQAVRDVSIDMDRDEVLGVVGESGSGKSVMGRSIMGLVKPPGRIVNGQVLFNPSGGQSIDLVSMTRNELRRIRGKNISMIFQEPMTSLNPILTIGDQMTEGVVTHGIDNVESAVEKAKAMLDMVRIKDPSAVMSLYPHQLSGGMRQRIMIAMALMCSPDLLIADEPTTALDVTIQAQVLELLKDIRKKTGMSMIFITHNMGVVAEISDIIVVMYCGSVMEYGASGSILKSPGHPYTKALINAIPKLTDDRKYLPAIPGSVPNLIGIGNGCAFASRCDMAEKICRIEKPPFAKRGSSFVSCHSVQPS